MRSLRCRRTPSTTRHPSVNLLSPPKEAAQFVPRLWPSLLLIQALLSCRLWCYGGRWRLLDTILVPCLLRKRWWICGQKVNGKLVGLDLSVAQILPRPIHDCGVAGGSTRRLDLKIGQANKVKKKLTTNLPGWEVSPVSFQEDIVRALIARRRRYKQTESAEMIGCAKNPGIEQPAKKIQYRLKAAHVATPQLDAISLLPPQV